MNPGTEFAVVTGASSGIGLELVRCFVSDGHPVVMVADGADKLEAAARDLRRAGDVQVETVACDLAAQDGPDQLYAAVGRLGVVPAWLVLNAGVAVHGDFVRETDLAEELAMIRLNVVAPVILAKRFGADMVRRGSGRILITSSIAALAPSPLLAVYSATKAFDYAFSEAIANELDGTGVTVTALMPDATETNFFAKADAQDTAIARGSKADPAAVARAGYDAMMRGTDHVLAPFSAKMKAALVSVLPAGLMTDRARAE